MTPTVEKSVQITAFSTIGGVFAAASILWMAGHGGIDLGFNYKSAKTMIAIVTAGGFPAAVLNWLFEKYAWRHAMFQGWLVKVPDISGVWTGPSISEFFKDENGVPNTVEMTAMIDHRFNEIVYKQNALAESLVLTADLTSYSKDEYRLIVTYENYKQGVDAEKLKITPELAKNSREHIGTHILTLSRPPDEKLPSRLWRLTGPYWTNKERIRGGGDRGTTGTLSLTWDCRLPKQRLFS